MRPDISSLAIALTLLATSALAQPVAPVHPTYKPQPEVYVPATKRPEAHDFFIEQMKPTGTTPRRADGHPDLTGYWNLGFPSPTKEDYARRANEFFEPDQAALQRSSHTYKPIYKPEYWDKVRSLDFSIVDTDPAYGCVPDGVPRMQIPPKIAQLDKEIWLYDGGTTRIIPIGTRTLTEDDADEATNNGISAAHWEGDVLVIESVGFNADTWLAWEGLFHTDRMKVKERLWREGNFLYYNYEVDDPTIFMRPWQSATQLKRQNTNPQAFMDEALPCAVHGIEGFLDKYYRG